jgi:hypothetical protein
MFSFFLFVAITIFLMGYILSAIRGLGQWNRSYSQLANRYGGKQNSSGVQFGYFFSTPTLSFNYGRMPCVLKSRRGLISGKGRITELSLKWPDPRMRVLLASPPVAHKAWGLKPVALPDHLGNVFAAYSGHPDSVLAMLTEAVVWRLEQLLGLGESRDLRIHIHRGEVLIAKTGYLKDYQTLDDFVRLSLELLDQLLLVYAEGIDFVENDGVVCTDVKCPICSEMIVQEMVVCPRCKTPHCLDCWEYNGQCATYACQETRYQRVAS